MSMFICIACDQYADSDDGCVEAPANYANKQRHGLICETCIANGVLEDDEQVFIHSRDMETALAKVRAALASLTLPTPAGGGEGKS